MKFESTRVLTELPEELTVDGFTYNLAGISFATQRHFIGVVYPFPRPISILPVYDGKSSPLVKEMPLSNFLKLNPMPNYAYYFKKY